jgi:ParB-like chromosome segregation protein Spo0J
VSLPYELKEVGIDWIAVPDGYIPVRHRRNTCDAIRVTNVMLPVVIRREGNSYVLVDGIERLKCARELGWQRVPALVIEDERADVLRVALNWVRGRLCGVDLIFAAWQLMQSYPIDVVRAVIGRSWETLRHYRQVAEHLMALGLSRRDFEALREACVPARRLVACAHQSREARELVQCALSVPRSHLKRVGPELAAAAVELARDSEMRELVEYIKLVGKERAVKLLELLDIIKKTFCARLEEYRQHLYAEDYRLLLKLCREA